jgi:hypothetical protein
VVENTAGAVDGNGADAQPALGDARLAHHLLADGEGLLEERIEGRAGRPAFAGLVVRVADLAQDLRLADDHRVERGCDAEEVSDDVALGLLVHVRRDASCRHVAQLGEERDHLVVARVAVHGAGGVELDAVAGVEQDRLDALELRAQRLQRIKSLRTREREPLAQFQRRGGVVQSQEEQPLHR